PEAQRAAFLEEELVRWVRAESETDRPGGGVLYARVLKAGGWELEGIRDVVLDAHGRVTSARLVARNRGVGSVTPPPKLPFQGLPRRTQHRPAEEFQAAVRRVREGKGSIADDQAILSRLVIDAQQTALAVNGL